MSVHKTNMTLKKHMNRYQRDSAIKLQPNPGISLASTDYRELSMDA